MKPSPRTALDSVSPERQRRLSAGLRALVEANGDALEVGFDPWQFALRLDELLVAGLTGGDVRWLIAHGVIAHARERSVADRKFRTFGPTAGLGLSDESSFVLDPTAVRVVQAWCVVVPASPCPVVASQRPRWDADRRELRWGDCVVKEYRVPASNQELVLSAFEEDGWPCRIDDPFPPMTGSDSGDRLHDAVRGLNRGQRHHLIVFRRDGRGGRDLLVGDERRPPPDADLTVPGPSPQRTWIAAIRQVSSSSAVAPLRFSDLSPGSSPCVASPLTFSRPCFGRSEQSAPSSWPAARALPGWTFGAGRN